MRLKRTQSKAEVAQGLERAYAGLLFDLEQVSAESAKIAGLLESLPAELDDKRQREAALRSQMEVLAASIQRFEPDWTGDGVQAKRVRQRLTPFELFEVGRHGLKLLRETGLAMGVPEILIDLCREKGVRYTQQLHTEQYAGVRQAMNNAVKRGIIVLDQRKPLKWKFVPKQEWAGAEPTVDYDFDAPPRRAATSASNP